MKNAVTLINRGMPVSVLKEGNNIFEKIISIKYDVANNQLDKFDQYKQDIDTFYDNIMEKKRLMPEQLHS